MAINALNFLKEIEASQSLTVSQVEQGLSYSPVGDCFDNDDWLKMYQSTQQPGATMDDLRAVAKSLLPKYEAEYIRLGSPKTAEEWKTAKWR